MLKFMKIFVSLFFLATFNANAYCNPNKIATNKSAVAVSNNNEFNASDVLALTDTATYSGTTNFSGYRLRCYTGGETLYYRNGIDGGYTVKFESGEQEFFIKFSASLGTSTKSFDSGLITTEYESSSFGSDFSFTAKVVSGTTYDASTSSSTIEIPVVYIVSSNYNNTYSTAASLRNLAATASTASSLSYTDFKGFASVVVTFSPTATTCTIQNQQFSLPSTTLYAIQQSETSDTMFSIPIDCSGSINSLATKTFNLRLYSNDLVDNTNYVIHNSSSTASGIGFQLFNYDSDPLLFNSSYDPTATSLGGMAKGVDLITSLSEINLGARYKVYDPSNMSSGTVIGTVIIYMEYE